MFESNRETAQGDRVGSSLQDVQNYLQNPSDFNEPDAAQLIELQNRLARVRCFGGALAAISFSPDVERLQNQSTVSNKTKMAAV